MLDYEKKLHLDKHYEMLTSAKTPRIVGAVIWSILEYGALFLLFKWMQTLVPDVLAWSGSGDWFTLWGMNFLKIDAGYFAAGLLIHIYGALRLARITRENHSVKCENTAAPQSLLTTGCYAKMRHPMYGSFVVLQSGFLLSMHSLWCMLAAVFIAVFYLFHALAEEKYDLIPLFGEKYRVYQKKVTRCLLSNAEITGLLLLLIASGVGFLA